MNKAFKKPYTYWTIAIFFVYLAINFLASGFYNTIKLIAVYADTVNWFKLGVSLVFTLVIGFLVGINSVLVYIKYKERKQCTKEGALAGAGAIAGLATGVCPLCVTGLFPLLFSLFGLSFSFASLPLNGLEVQILTIAMLAISLKMLK
ncbi:MAG: hypothetical protein AABX73_01385 [Nanoarchaeota archaeon]